MMDVMDHLSDTLDQTLEQMATNEFREPAVLKLSQTNQIYVSLADETDLEVYLIESDNKHILLEPAHDEEAQIEAGRDSGASSCIIGFKEVFNNYKEQQIPI
jgi:hypothetical protein